MKNPPMIRRASLKSLQVQTKAVAAKFQSFFNTLGSQGCSTLSQLTCSISKDGGSHE